jgi:hypothetical protein
LGSTRRRSITSASRSDGECQLQRLLGGLVSDRSSKDSTCLCGSLQYASDQTHPCGRPTGASRKGKRAVSDRHAWFSSTAVARWSCKSAAAPIDRRLLVIGFRTFARVLVRADFVVHLRLRPESIAMADPGVGQTRVVQSAQSETPPASPPTLRVERKEGAADAKGFLAAGSHREQKRHDRATEPSRVLSFRECSTDSLTSGSRNAQLGA